MREERKSGIQESTRGSTLRHVQQEATAGNAIEGLQIDDITFVFGVADSGAVSRG